MCKKLITEGGNNATKINYVIIICERPLICNYKLGFSSWPEVLGSKKLFYTDARFVVSNSIPCPDD